MANWPCGSPASRTSRPARRRSATCKREALDALEPAVALAIERFDGWEGYGRSFLEGERDAAGSNFMGRKVLASVTERLLEDERSPWKTLAWPTRDALPALLASR